MSCLTAMTESSKSNLSLTNHEISLLGWRHQDEPKGLNLKNMHLFLKKNLMWQVETLLTAVILVAWDRFATTKLVESFFYLADNTRVDARIDAKATSWGLVTLSAMPALFKLRLNDDWFDRPAPNSASKRKLSSLSLFSGPTIWPISFMKFSASLS